MPSSFILTIPTTTSPVRVARLRKLPASVDQATMTLTGSSAALPVSARYSDFVRAPMGPIERSSGHGAWKAEVSATLDVGESWNLGLFLAHALKAHGRLQEQQGDVAGDAPRAVWATGAVDVIDLRILPVGNIETKLRQALGVTPAPDLFLLPPDNLGDVAAELRAELEARGTRIIAPATMSEALEALGLPSDWAKEAAPDLAGWRGDPYRGLEAYQAEHRPIFFGRACARTEALERLRTRAERGNSLLVIHGKSGVGKSSLAMAGLLDDVVEQVPGRAPFGTATIRFGDGATPLAALRAGFAQALELEEASALQSSAAADWIGKWPENSEPRTVLLILDQLEQALLADEADTIAFGEAIATLVQTGRVWVIATLRSDRIDLLERAPALAEMADGDALYRLVRPTLAELGEIIRAPAKLAGIAFEEGSGTDLVNLLAEEAMRAPDSLPLLQVTLMRLADQRDADGRVGMRDYERIGGFSGAVGRLADETVRKMEAEGIDGSVVDRTLASLVRIDTDTDRVDARVVDPDAQTEEVQQVLSALVESRLATASTVNEALDPDTERGSVESSGPNDSGRRVRLAHETLIREWPRLHDLAVRLRSEISLRDRLEDDALRWDQDGRPKGDLIRNTARLSAAEALIADGLATPSPQAQTYIEASRAEVESQAEQRRAAAALEHRTQTRRRITSAAAVVAVIILGFTGFAINQAQQRQAAQELAAAAEEAEVQAQVLTDIATEAQRSAEAQLRQTQRTESALLTEKGRLNFNRADFAAAISLAYSGLPHDEHLSERPVLPETERLLRESLARNRLRAVIDLTETAYGGYDFAGQVNFEQLQAVGSKFAVSRIDGLRLFDSKNGLREVVHVEGLAAGYGLCILEERFVVALTLRGGLPPFDQLMPGLLFINLETEAGVKIALPGQPRELRCNDAHARIYFTLENGLVGHFDPRTNDVALFSVSYPDKTGRARVSPARLSNQRAKDSLLAETLHSSDDGSAFAVGFWSRSGDWACALEHPLGEEEAIQCFQAPYDTSRTWPPLSRNGVNALTITGGFLSLRTGEVRNASVDAGNFSRGFFRTETRDLVIYFSDSDLRVVDVDTLEIIFTVPIEVDKNGRHPNGQVAGDIQHWPDHGLVTAISGDRLHVLRLDDTEISEIWQRSLESGRNRVLTSGDGRRLAVINVGNRRVVVRDLSNGKIIVDFELPKAGAKDIFALSSDGSILVQFSEDGLIQEWAVDLSGQVFAKVSPSASLAHAIYLPDLEGFVASSRDGLHFLGPMESIVFDNPSLHRDLYNDHLAAGDIELAKKYPGYEPMPNNDGRSLLHRAGANAFVSAGWSGMPALWALEGNRFEYRLLDLKGGPPFKYQQEISEKPSIWRVSVNPGRTHAVAVKWNNEGHCLFDLQSATLIKCRQIPEYTVWNWVGGNFYVLYGLPLDDPRHDQGYRYVTRILSSTALASEDSSEVLHKSFALPIDGSRWVTIPMSSDRGTIEDVLIGSSESPESIGFSFKTAILDLSLTLDLIDEGKLFVGRWGFLPIRYRIGGSDRLRVAVVDIVEKQVTCVMDFDLKTRTKPLIEPTPDPDKFIMGARAKLMNVQTCELLEVLNPTENGAIAVHLINGAMSLLLDNGSILERSFYPPLATVIKDARFIVGNLATASGPIDPEDISSLVTNGIKD